MHSKRKQGNLKANFVVMSETTNFDPFNKAPIFEEVIASKMMNKY